MKHTSGTGMFAGKVIRHLPFLLVLVAVNGLIYREYWSFDKIITGKDFLTSFYPLLNFQSDCLREHSWPLWNPFMNFGYPFVEHYANTALFPSHLVMGLLTHAGLKIIQWELLTWVILGGFGVYLCVREFGHSPMAAIVSAISFMFCGQVFPLAQWSLLVYNAACFPYLILGYHRAKRLNDPFSIISIAFLTMSIFGGYIAATVLSLYLFGTYVLVDSLWNRNSARGLKYLALTFTLSLMLALPKLLPLYESLGAGPRMAASVLSKDPFNVVNLYNFLSCLIPVKFYFSLYIGLGGLIALLTGILKKQFKIDSLLVLFIFAAWLFMVDSSGNVSLLRRATAWLPLMSLVRNEWLYWFYPLIFLILYLAQYFDQFFSSLSKRQAIIGLLITVVLLTTCFLVAYNTSLYLDAFLIQVAITVAWFAVPFLVSRPWLQHIFLILLVTVEFSTVFNRVNQDETPVKEGNSLKIAVTDQMFENPSLDTDEPRGRKFIASAVDDEARPPISQSTKWPVLESGLAGDPTYNLYPEQFGRCIDSMNLKRFSGWWYNTQERFDFIRIKDSPLLSELEGKPLFALFDMATRAPAQSVAFKSISCSQFVFDVATDSPSFLLLHQIYDPRWKAVIDYQETKIERANEFFMGVRIAPGRHRIKFVFEDRLFMTGLIISSLTLLGIVGVAGHGAFRKKLRGEER